MVQGMTAHYLAKSTFPLKPGDTALIHAGAGGTGRLLVQVAKQCGARVIATAGTPAKAELARSAGADEVILYAEQDFEPEVKRLTDGRGVDVVYDSVGKTTFAKGLNCLRPRGMMVLWGQASGAVEPLEPQLLNQKGSLYLTRPSLGAYIADRGRTPLARRRTLSMGRGRQTGRAHRPDSAPGAGGGGTASIWKRGRRQGRCCSNLN